MGRLNFLSVLSVISYPHTYPSVEEGGWAIIVPASWNTDYKALAGDCKAAQVGDEARIVQ